MSHVKLKEVLTAARQKRYGVPCLLAGNMEMVIGAIKAAEEKKSPLILAYNASVTPKIQMDLAIPFMANAAKKARVPVATILDHGSDFDAIVKSMYYGLSSVMFDGSCFSFQENIQRTKEIVKIGHSLGLSVEAELGNVGGSVLETNENGKDNSVFTDPDRVEEFVSKTDIDALAISFGNMHGLYTGVPKLDIERLEKIYKKVEIPLVMHGGSGLSAQDYKTVIEHGISKINYYTVMGKGAVENIRKLLGNLGTHVGFHDIISESVDYFYQESMEILDMFGCSGRAMTDDTR